MFDAICGHHGPAKLTHKTNHQGKTGVHAIIDSTVLMHTRGPYFGVGWRAC